MRNRRDFMKAMAAAAAGMSVAGRLTDEALAQGGAPKRREVFIGRKRIKVIDSHNHLNIADVARVVKDTPFERQAVTTGDGIIGPERIAWMDRDGIDVAMLTQQGAFWYAVQDRGLAREIVKAQNEGTAAVVAKYPDRFLGMASMPLQFPDLAAEALEDGIKRLGFKGGGISAGWAGAKNFSGPGYGVFRSKGEELGAFLFMHPGGTNGNGDPHFAGKGALGNTIGNPLETTIFFSRLIYDGTLDKFPGLKICGAHGGGYLPSYLGRTDAQCRRQDDGGTGKKRPVEDYFHTQLMADIMAFREVALRDPVAELGVGQLVYGTDNPFGWPA